VVTYFVFVLLVLSVVAYLVFNQVEKEMAKTWCPQDHIWLMFAGALLLLWAAFRAWDGLAHTSAHSLREEIADLKLQLARQKRRYLTSDQRAAFVEALRDSGEPICINVVYHHLDAEAESYAAQFSAVLVPERLGCAPIPLDDIPADLEGVVVRVNNRSVPHLVQRLSGALTKARIDHRIEPLTGKRVLLVPRDYFDLTIGRMN
jgi:hypothetical protein